MTQLAQRLAASRVCVKDYVTLLAADNNFRQLWEMKGPKDTDVAIMQAWLVGRHVLLIALWKSGGFQDYPATPWLETDRGAGEVQHFWERSSPGYTPRIGLD